MMLTRLKKPLKDLRTHLWKSVKQSTLRPTKNLSKVRRVNNSNRLRDNRKVRKKRRRNELTRSIEFYVFNFSNI
jgi:hypothetical protein